MRSYEIEDDGDEVQVQLFDGGVQVGGAMFPEGGDGQAFMLAYQLGENWAGFPSATVSGLKLH